MAKSAKSTKGAKSARRTQRAQRDSLVPIKSVVTFVPKSTLSGVLMAGTFLGAGPRMSLTYGELPNRNDFWRHWVHYIGRGRPTNADGTPVRYSYTLRGRDAQIADSVGIPDSGDVTAREMYALLEKLVAAWEDGDDSAGDLASSFLATLGFEWV